MPLHRRLPKRGFTNPFRREYSIVNFIDIDKAINSKKLDPKKEVTKKELVEAGIIRKNSNAIKLLAKGKLTHNITIKVNKASKKASDELSKIKGKLVIEELKVINLQKENNTKKKEI